MWELGKCLNHCLEQSLLAVYVDCVLLMYLWNNIFATPEKCVFSTIVDVVNVSSAFRYIVIVSSASQNTVIVESVCLDFSVSWLPYHFFITFIKLTVFSIIFRRSLAYTKDFIYHLCSPKSADNIWMNHRGERERGRLEECECVMGKIATKGPRGEFVIKVCSFR